MELHYLLCFQSFCFLSVVECKSQNYTGTSASAENLENALDKFNESIQRKAAEVEIGLSFRCCFSFLEVFK